MRLEMEGKEPLVVFFGLPLVTAAIVIVSMHYGQANTQIVPPPPINVEAPSVNPRVTAEIPQGSIRIQNEVPPAQIHEVVREVVKVPEIRVEPGRAPDVHVTLPPGKEGETKIIAVPAPVPVPMNVTTESAKTEAAKPTETIPEPKNAVEKTTDPADPDGKLLPPPKTYVDPRLTPPAR
ncbi:MAG: hypothetical protein KIS92_25495 [Planctomycetota bacterium]|nr:hypothetical protein [Planctomycetota bacterium]